jgi:polyhydroxyalkanoate synthesis regulator protein
VFLDQQQQFRNQLNSLMGQTPWSMLNEMTERNLDVWKSMQRGFLDAATAKPAEPAARTTRPTGKKAS